MRRILIGMFIGAAFLALAATAIKLQAQPVAAPAPEGKVEETPMGSVQGLKMNWSSLYISDDRSHMACAAQKGNKWLVVVDGKPGQEYDDIMKGYPVLSPDGKRVAYSALVGKKWVMVIDDKAGPECDLISKG